MSKAAQRTIFARAIAFGATMKDAASMAGISATTATAWMSDERVTEQIDSFTELSPEALSADSLRHLRDMAINGWEEEVFQQGGLVGHKRRFSPDLVLKLATLTNPHLSATRCVFNLPEGDPDEQLQAVLRATASGQLTLEQSERLVKLMATGQEWKQAMDIVRNLPELIKQAQESAR